MLSDKGKVFVGKVMQEVQKMLDIKGIRTSPYRPSTNGLTERFNKTLAEMLSKYVDIKQKDWDTYIPYVLFTYRTTIQASTKHTPFYLLYGRSPQYPADLFQ